MKRRYNGPQPTLLKRLASAAEGVGTYVAANNISHAFERQIANAVNNRRNMAPITFPDRMHTKRTIEAAKKQQTDRKYGRNRLYGRGYTNGKYRAKYAARTFVKRYRNKKGKKRFLKKVRGVVKRQFNGACYQGEITGTISDARCVYLTHSTACPKEMMTTFVMSLVKQVALALSYPIPEWEGGRSSIFATGDIFYLWWRQSNFATVSATGSTYTVVAGDVTFMDIVNNWTTTIVNSMITGGIIFDGSFPVSVDFASSGQKPIKVNLLDAKINFFIKSSMKIQNRTVAAAGDDEVDVNNVPISGRIYNGVGNGPVLRNIGANSNLFNGVSFKNPAALAAGSVAQLSEPPAACDFTYCKRYGKVVLQPGAIKTCWLTSKLNVLVANFWKKINQYYNGTNSYERFELGLFNTVAYEKVLGKLAAESDISVAYEVDYKIWATLKPNVQKFTLPFKDCV